MDLFSLISRAGRDHTTYQFDYAPDLWDEMLLRGATVHQSSVTLPTDPPATVREFALLRLGKAALYVERTRKMTATEHAARRARREEEARRDEQALLDDPPFDVYRETAQKDAAMGTR